MYEFQVEKMKCGGCASQVTKAIQSVDTAAKVDIDLASKTARVDSNADMKLLTAAVTAAGYPAFSNAANSPRRASEM